MTDLPVNDTTARLDALLANVQVLSDSQFAIADGPALDVARFAVMPRPQAPHARDNVAAPLRNALSSAIYTFGYTRVYAGGPCSADGLDHAVQTDAALLASLVAANPTHAGWDRGWKVFQLEAHGAVHVQKGDRAILAQPGQFAFPAGGGRSPVVGEFVDVLIIRDSLVLQPGRYFAFGQTIAGDYDFARIARLYLNASHDQAAWLLATTGGLLNRYFVPYRFKCALDPKAFDRTDSVVLYLARRFLPTALRLFRPLTEQLEARLRPGTPLFSKPLLNGLGAADDPGTGESFGQARSRLVADGIVDAWLGGSSDAARRREAVAARFAQAGMSLQQGHLRTGLVDLYSWPSAGSA